MEFRKVFDTIPEQFDQHRVRYCPELFTDLIAYAGIDSSKTVLELGPGTGQATEPILDTGCDYHAIELGEHLAAKMVEKFGNRPNFHITVDDFITHDFGTQKFDMIYSAATIQWIPEEIAFAKTFDLLKPGGVLAMMLTRGNYRESNEELYQAIQAVYKEHFVPEMTYSHGSFQYTNAVNYGYTDLQRREYPTQRTLTADEYVAFSGTHCDHIVIRPEHREPFFSGLRNAVLAAGNQLVMHENFILYTVRKPE